MTPLGLHSFHAARHARFTSINGFEIVASYSDPFAEYNLLTSSTALLDLSARSRICLLGADREKFIHGQVTNEVLKLHPAHGTYAFLVNAKGKIQSDLFLYKLPEEILLDFEPGLTQRVIERLERYIIAEDVQIVDVAPHYGLLSIQGPQAVKILTQSALFNSLPSAPFQSASHSTEHGDLYIMNNPRIKTAGFDLYIPAAAMETFAARLPIPWAGFDAFEIARIEHGIPRFGVDMDENNLAPETGLENEAISYAKGCYIGQEVIARVRTYGRPAKSMRRLQLSGEAPVQSGDKLFKDGKEAGYLTSITASPRLKSSLALGYVRKEFNAPGTILNVGNATTARVLDPPGTGPC